MVLLLGLSSAVSRRWSGLLLLVRSRQGSEAQPHGVPGLCRLLLATFLLPHLGSAGTALLLALLGSLRWLWLCCGGGNEVRDVPRVLVQRGRCPHRLVRPGEGKLAATALARRSCGCRVSNFILRDDFLAIRS